MMETALDTSTHEESNQNISTSSKESEENLEAIKKFLEEQEKEILQDGNKDKNLPADIAQIVENLEVPDDETMTVAASVMDMILTQSEAKLAETEKQEPDKKEGKEIKPKQEITSDKGSTTLSVGSKVEAKDFEEDWYPAEITEIDFDEMEVLVHYTDLKKTDEWISVNSTRLRPYTGEKPTPKLEQEIKEDLKEVIQDIKDELDEVKEEPVEVKEEVKPLFVEGERCSARWRDNRRFMATVSKDLGNGQYEIIFDDGFVWKCGISRLHKWKPTAKSEGLSVEVSQSPATGPQSPVYGAGPSNAFHTHLFDPTRDYLSSKSERREMKRKLNIKEIFNIGQKKQKVQKDPKPKPAPKPAPEKKPKVVKKKPKNRKVQIKTEVNVENPVVIPDAVASIIGTLKQEEPTKEELLPEDIKLSDTPLTDFSFKEDMQVDNIGDTDDMKNDAVNESSTALETNSDGDPVLDEEVMLENFYQNENDNQQEVIDKIKEAISKLEDGIFDMEKTEPSKDQPQRTEIKLELIEEETKPEENQPKSEPGPCLDTTTSEALPGIADTTEVTDITEVVVVDPNAERPKKVKKGKKLRMLQEKKVKKQVEAVKSELEEMKRQFEEMRSQMLLKTQELSQGKHVAEMPESFLLPGEWCCRWVNNQPVGKVSEIEAEAKLDANNKPALPRRSVEVEDRRLPPGWTKHMVRRSVGNSAGKWDVVLVNPENKRFHTKVDMRNYLESVQDDSLKPYESALMDFGVHLKLSRRMGWIQNTPDGVAEAPAKILPAGSEACLSPLVKKKPLSLSLKRKNQKKLKRRPIKMKLQRKLSSLNYNSELMNEELAAAASSMEFGEPVSEEPVMPLEDGYVYVGSLKVQVIDTFLRCPAEGCFKNFRNNTLLQMHIKHYHRELRKKLGATPKVLDLASARTKPILAEQARSDSKVIKVKIPRPQKREEPKPDDLYVETSPLTPTEDIIPKTQDSPKLRHALNKPVKRPKVLLPVRRVEPEQAIPDSLNNEFENLEPNVDIPMPALPLDFETAISTHTVTKPLDSSFKKKKGDKKQKSFAQISKTISEDEEWFTMNSDDIETRSSFPRSGTPDINVMEGGKVPMSSESNEEQRDANMYTYTETGERVKIVHMKREEIINCHCGFREEDGLMVQCELCLCWQHALCHNIQTEAEVPEKYTCSICLNPRRGRRSKRFLHDQDRMYEGLLPGGTPCGTLRRSHELSGNLLRLQDALHALRVKIYVADKENHPKLYLWAKDWEAAEITYTQERLNSDYSDLSIMINGLGKENMPVKDDVTMPLDITSSSPTDDHDLERFSQRDVQLGSHSLLSGLLSSPGGASLDLPISTSELERLAKTVQEEAEWQRVSAPQPEAAIENDACRVRLLKHIHRCQTLIDTRLDSIEAQVAELESQDPSFGEGHETAEFYPRTKQTIQMLMRDLEAMEELGVIT